MNNWNDESHALCHQQELTQREQADRDAETLKQDKEAYEKWLDEVNNAGKDTRATKRTLPD